jgi:hypothetical protein
MLTFQSSAPRTNYARTWSFSQSNTATDSTGISTGTPTSTRASTTVQRTTVASGSGVEGSSSQNAIWGTVRSSTRRSGGTTATFSATFSSATTHLIGSASTTRAGTVTGSATRSPTSFTFAVPTYTTSSNTTDPLDVITTTTTTRHTTTTVSSSTTVSTATASVTTSLPTTAETTATVTWSLTSTPASITQIEEYLLANSAATLSSPPATDAFYPEATVAAVPCNWAYISPTPLTAATPLTALATATEFVTTLEVLTFTTNATTAVNTTSENLAAGGSSTVASTYNYARIPDSQLGSTYLLVTGGAIVDVPRIPIGWQNAISSGTFWPLGTSYTISVATTVTDTDESLLRRAGTTTQRDEAPYLVLTLNTADTLSLLGTTAVTLSVPIEGNGIAEPGGGYPDGNAVASITWLPGILEVTSVTATVLGSIASGSYRTTILSSYTSTLPRAMALGIRGVPALLPTGTYAAPATTASAFTALSTPYETRTGANAVTWIDSTCQPTWPDPGDDEIDGIFD